MQASAVAMGFLLALMPFMSQTAQGQAIQASISPSRTTGVAPLAVYFDATGTTSSNPSDSEFLDLLYTWNFGDPGSGSWSTTGKSKNLAYGPVAAHVYDQPGTYPVTLTVTDALGNTSLRQASITVADPDTVFAGTATNCFSTSGNFTGCPSGAQRITTSEFGAEGGVMAHVAAGRRLLLRRGEQWTTNSGAVITNLGPGIIGAFATGPKPRINGAGISMPPGGKPRDVSDWRIMDLDFHGPTKTITDGDSSMISAGSAKVSQVLLYRLSGQDYGHPLHFSRPVVDWFSELAIVDCDIKGIVGGKNAVMLKASKLMVLGNDFRNGSHVLRIGYMNGGVLSHNYLADAKPERHELKLHAPSFDGNNYTQNWVISDNKFKAGGQLSARISPQNSTFDERIRRGIIERNYFVSGPSTIGILSLSTVSTVAVRNNIFNMSDGSSFRAITLSQENVAIPPPNNHHFSNNTCYAKDTGTRDVWCIKLGQISPNFNEISMVNNLLYGENSPKATAVAYCAGANNCTNAGNLLATATTPFVSSALSAFSAPEDFRLAPGSAAIDAGVNLETNLQDYATSGRPTDGDGDGIASWDIGAYEFSSSDATPPSAPVLLE